MRISDINPRLKYFQEHFDLKKNHIFSKNIIYTYKSEAKGRIVAIF